MKVGEELPPLHLSAQQVSLGVLKYLRPLWSVTRVNFHSSNLFSHFIKSLSMAIVLCSWIHWIYLIENWPLCRFSSPSLGCIQHQCLISIHLLLCKMGTGLCALIGCRVGACKCFYALKALVQQWHTLKWTVVLYASCQGTTSFLFQGWSPNSRDLPTPTICWSKRKIITILGANSNSDKNSL